MNTPKTPIKLTDDFSLNPTVFKQPKGLKTEFSISTAAAAAIMLTPFDEFKLPVRQMRSLWKRREMSIAHNNDFLGKGTVQNKKYHNLWEKSIIFLTPTPG